MSVRLAAWLFVTCLSALGCFTYGQLVSEFDADSIWRILLPGCFGICGLLMVLLSPGILSLRSSVFIIWIPAIIFRLLLLPTAPSDDVNRYLWEGKLVREGISPYAQTADAEEWKVYRDQFWDGMNHKDKLTAYPPITEVIFGLIGYAGYHPLAYKCFFVWADLLTLAAVTALLKRRGVSQTYAGFYAFNPLILLSFAAEAHFDILMMVPLVWALWLYESGRLKTAVALAAISSGVKWVTLPLLPFFAKRQLVRGGLISAIVLLLPCLYFWDTIHFLIEGLLDFGGTRSFNGPVYDVLHLWLGLPRIVAIALVGSAFAGILLWRWRERECSSLDGQIRWILGALVVLSPTVHFWYLAWLMPFVAIRPTAMWLSFSITGGLYFFVWSNSYWGLLPWQQILFWAPFALAAIYELWSTGGGCIFPKRRVLDGSGGVSIVIPTLNAAGELNTALESIASQSEEAKEVILADAGSADGSVSLAESSGLPVRVVPCEKGRGNQIAAGMEAASSEWVIVLHADCVMDQDAVQSVLLSASSNPRMVGGAMGQRFDGNAPHLLLVELLNDIRSLFSRTAFGDQVQFFHRKTALEFFLMPKQPLMEDVESSWRLREYGETVFLGRPCVASALKWDLSAAPKRFALVFSLVSRYRWRRFKSRAAAEMLSKELYKEYYG